eukprot:jgi/Orpsp1_1/1182989/evm.model.c7180000083392.1
MKLNIFSKSLLLTVGIAANTVAGAAITKPAVSWKEQCMGPDMEFEEQTLCGEKDGYIIHAYMKDYDCDLKYACFLKPNTTPNENVIPIKAKNPTECIKIRGEYYCSADFNNIDCPNCSFPEFVQKVSLTIGSFFRYDLVDENDQIDFSLDESSSSKIIPEPKSTKTLPVPVPITTTTTITSKVIPSSTAANVVPWKEQCMGPDMEFEEQTLCGEKDGYIIHAYMKDYDCDLKYACFLKPNTTPNENVIPIKAKNPTECIKIRGEYYCSADLNNMDCPDCSFPEFVQKVSSVIGRFFKYEFVNENDDVPFQNEDSVETSTAIPEPKSTKTLPVPITTTITTTSKTSKVIPSSTATNVVPWKEQCMGPDMEFEEQTLCGEKDGYIIHAYMKDYDCDLKYACFLKPNTTPNENVIPIKAKNPTECIKIRGEYYCSADLNNMDCPDCSFPEFVQKVSS